MELIELNINRFLYLENFHFKNSNNNIDFLNHQATLSKDLDKRLSLLILATEKIEKFHSYFHFEQSYFHLQLAIHLKKENKIDEANKQLELSIFQDHANEQAIALLNNNKEHYNPYTRQYNTFSDYLYFATEEKGDTVGKNNYWDDYLNYQKSLEREVLEIIIARIRHSHLEYHKESAKLYLNRAITFYQLDQIDLFKNDLVKANNLDNELKTREYYNMVEMSGIEPLTTCVQGKRSTN